MNTMKRIAAMCLVITTVIFGVSSCKKSSDGTTNGPLIDSTFNPATATLVKQGSFSGNMSYTVSGSAKIYDQGGKKYLYLENFSSSAGPDLKVYVATTNNAAQFVNLGALKSRTGNQSYLITNPPDFNTYNKVLIWCQQFSVLFGASTVQ
jgi:hypothetical protein